MKRLAKVAMATVAIALLTAVGIRAVDAASAITTATATIVRALFIERVEDLQFGRILQDAVGGSVTIAPDGSRTAVGVVLDAGDVGGAGQFTVTGEPTVTYAITLPSVPVTLLHTDGINSMDVDAFTADPNPTGLLGPGGAQFILVGGTLTVGASQLDGLYSGDFTVTVNLN